MDQFSQFFYSSFVIFVFTNLLQITSGFPAVSTDFGSREKPVFNASTKTFSWQEHADSFDQVGLQLDAEFFSLMEVVEKLRADELLLSVKYGINSYCRSILGYSDFKNKVLEDFNWATRKGNPVHAENLSLTYDGKRNNAEKLNIYDVRFFGIQDIAPKSVEVSTTDAELLSLFYSTMVVPVPNVTICGNYDLVLKDRTEHGSFCYEFSNTTFIFDETVRRIIGSIETTPSGVLDFGRSTVFSPTGSDFMGVEDEMRSGAIRVYLPVYTQLVFALSRADKRYLGMIENISHLYRDRVLEQVLDLLKFYLEKVDDEFTVPLSDGSDLHLSGLSRYTDSSITENIQDLQDTQLVEISVYLDYRSKDDNTSAPAQISQHFFNNSSSTQQYSLQRVDMKFLLSINPQKFDKSSIKPVSLLFDIDSSSDAKTNEILTFIQSELSGKILNFLNSLEIFSHSGIPPV